MEIISVPNKTFFEQDARWHLREIIENKIETQTLKIKNHLGKKLNPETERKTNINSGYVK